MCIHQVQSNERFFLIENVFFFSYFGLPGRPRRTKENPTSLFTADGSATTPVRSPTTAATATAERGRAFAEAAPIACSTPETSRRATPVNAHADRPTIRVRLPLEIIDTFGDGLIFVVAPISIDRQAIE